MVLAELLFVLMVLFHSIFRTVLCSCLHSLACCAPFNKPARLFPLVSLIILCSPLMIYFCFLFQVVSTVAGKHHSWDDWDVQFDQMDHDYNLPSAIACDEQGGIVLFGYSSAYSEPVAIISGKSYSVFSVVVFFYSIRGNPTTWADQKRTLFTNFVASCSGTPYTVLYHIRCLLATEVIF
jgi:hypothetical protein